MQSWMAGLMRCVLEFDAVAVVGVGEVAQAFAQRAGNVACLLVQCGGAAAEAGGVLIGADDVRAGGDDWSRLGVSLRPRWRRALSRGLSSTATTGRRCIAHFLHLAPSTAYRVLTRYSLARLSHLDRTTSRVEGRYERDRPGELIQIGPLADTPRPDSRR
ncbi:hypothetical protein [Streptomyces luteogriseus]|uniref:hypothetical protein n=1 Tax=Streptomyces luteogriseus TaxID=68233 RepID=UPI0036A99D82